MLQQVKQDKKSSSISETGYLIRNIDLRLRKQPTFRADANTGFPDDWETSAEFHTDDGSLPRSR